MESRLSRFCPAFHMFVFSVMNQNLMASPLASLTSVESLALHLHEVKGMLHELHWSMIGQFQLGAALIAAADDGNSHKSVEPSFVVPGNMLSAGPMPAAAAPSPSKLRRQRAKQAC